MDADLKRGSFFQNVVTSIKMHGVLSQIEVTVFTLVSVVSQTALKISDEFMGENVDKPKSLRSGKPVVSRIQKYRHLMFNEFEGSIIVSCFSFPKDIFLFSFDVLLRRRTPHKNLIITALEAKSSLAP